VNLTSWAGCPACARKCRPCRLHPTSTGSSLCAPFLSELAKAEQLAELARLICREDIPRSPQRLPQPLTTEQDQLPQKEFLRRNDLGSNVFLLIRHTRLRIGE